MKSLIALAALLFWPPGRAMATLGGPAQSVITDQQMVGGPLQTFTRQQFQRGVQTPGELSSADSQYSVEQISIPSGVTVNEYVSADGTVFAVSWRGPRLPDLSQLLGAYFAEYQTAAAAPRAQRHHLSLRTKNLVVDSSGHMRDLRGRAYLPALLPAGISADEIQ